MFLIYETYDSDLDIYRDTFGYVDTIEEAKKAKKDLEGIYKHYELNKYLIEDFENNYGKNLLIEKNVKNMKIY